MGSGGGLRSPPTTHVHPAHREAGARQPWRWASSCRRRAARCCSRGSASRPTTPCGSPRSSPRSGCPADLWGAQGASAPGERNSPPGLGALPRASRFPGSLSLLRCPALRFGSPASSPGLTWSSTPLPWPGCWRAEGPMPVAEGVHGDEIQSTSQAQCPQERASFVVQTTCCTDHWHPIRSGCNSAGLQ